LLGSPRAVDKPASDIVGHRRIAGRGGDQRFAQARSDGRVGRKRLSAACASKRRMVVAAFCLFLLKCELQRLYFTFKLKIGDLKVLNFISQSAIFAAKISTPKIESRILAANGSPISTDNSVVTFFPDI
jgi:hypothetical protein